MARASLGHNLVAGDVGEYVGERMKSRAGVAMLGLGLLVSFVGSYVKGAWFLGVIAWILLGAGVLLLVIPGRKTRNGERPRHGPSHTNAWKESTGSVSRGERDRR